MKVKCWKCNGRGWLYDHVVGIFTFGMGYLAQFCADGRHVPPNCVCPICHGKGYQETKE